jgi:hypothetical protein
MLCIPVALALALAPAGAFQRHDASFCAAISCHSARCTGSLYASNATLPVCQAQCEAERCACFQWRDPSVHHPSPEQPSCLSTNGSAALDHSGYGYAAFTATDRQPAPMPSPAPPHPVPPSRTRLYTTRGAIEVDTNENTMFLWHAELYVLENIPCYYSQHASRWDPAYANASYARIRRFDNGEVVVNVSSSISFGFVSAFVDEDLDTVWLFGSACNRCPPPPGQPKQPQGCRSGGHGSGGAVQVWSNRPDKTSLLHWDSTAASGTANTFNVEVTRVRSTAQEQQAAGLPPHRYAMILEISDRFAINNNADGDLAKGWDPIPGAVNPHGEGCECNGGPSIRWNPLDSMYYAILGGHHVELVRTRDFKTCASQLMLATSIVALWSTYSSCSRSCVYV